MKDLIVMLDPGHGGLIDGKYQTAGKRSPERPDGTVLYEGVNNRRIVEELKKAFTLAGIRWVDLVDSQEDIPLYDRIRKANKVTGKKLYLSIHSNAAGKNGEWSTARGFGTYIYPTCSKTTEDWASRIHRNLVFNCGELTKDRGIRRRDFAVLRETNHPAVLLELGFHSNLEESYLIESERWSQRVVNAIVDAIAEISNLK